MDEQKKEITMAVGQRIRKFRRIRAISQEEVAFRADLNPAYFGQVERGEKCPTVDTLCKVAKALGVSPADLLREEVLPGDMTEHSRRVQELLAKVPADKMDQVIRLLEDVVNLF